MVFLPVSEAGVEDVRPEPCAIAIDILFALWGERDGLLKGGVRAGGVAHFRVVAAEVIPHSGVLVLFVDGDGASQDILCFRKHVIASQWLRRGRSEIDDRAVDAEMAGLDIARRLRWNPLACTLGSKGTRGHNAQRDASEQQIT